MLAGRRARHLATGVAVLVLLCVVCVGLGWGQWRNLTSWARAEDVHHRHTERLLSIRQVVGTALGERPDGSPTIRVFTDRPSVAGVPASIEGVPVTIEVTGEFIALARWPVEPTKAAVRLSPTDRWPRPVPIGVSTGNEEEISAGTITCRVTDGTSFYALSCNHVYALENDASDNSRVLQPGRYDTRRYQVLDANVIGELYDFEPILFATKTSKPNNFIDAAIALSDDSLLSNTTPSDGYGTPGSVPFPATTGLRVQKYGRTTRLTKGSVYAVNANVLVGYSSGQAQFVNQIVVKGRGFIRAGDSGSLLVTDPGRAPVGLLFAGTSDGSYAIANPIDLVLDAFGVDIE